MSKANLFIPVLSEIPQSTTSEEHIISPSCPFPKKPIWINIPISIWTCSFHPFHHNILQISQTGHHISKNVRSKFIHYCAERDTLIHNFRRAYPLTFFYISKKRKAVYKSIWVCDLILPIMDNKQNKSGQRVSGLTQMKKSLIWFMAYGSIVAYVLKY